jgi:hypothetical protein
LLSKIISLPTLIVMKAAAVDHCRHGGQFASGRPFVYPQNIWALRNEVQDQAIQVETIVGVHLLPTPSGSRG